MDIQALKKAEKFLLAKMPQSGHFEEREAFLTSHGIYEEWRSLFEQYTELAKAGDIEALKRAIFLAWYEVAEPEALSGLKDLPRREAVSLMEYLNQQLELGFQDNELKWMLPYYYMIAEWYIPENSNVNALVNYSSKNGALFKSSLQKISFEDRGLLGEYWCSMQL